MNIELSRMDVGLRNLAIVLQVISAFHTTLIFFQKSSNINTLLQELCRIFTQNPPVYTISRGPSNSISQQSQGNSHQDARPSGSLCQDPPAQGSKSDGGFFIC